MLIVKAWLGATDAEIMSAFEKELRKAREQHPTPVRKPGPQALKGIIGEAEFARWGNHKVVEISDMLDWGAREGRAVSNADLGRWLFEKRSDPDKAAHEALKSGSAPSMRFRRCGHKRYGKFARINVKATQPDFVSNHTIQTE